MKRNILPVFVLALAPSAAIHAQSRDDIAKQLAGMWRLVGNPQRLADGTTRQGANTTGYAFFDAAGTRMCFLSMNPSRTPWKAGTPAPEEAQAAIRGFGAYCATIEINPREGFMDRRYDLNLTPNAVGRATRRWYTFQGPDRMSLRVDPGELNAPVVETLFIWERVNTASR